MTCSTLVVRNSVSPPEALILASCADKSVAFGSMYSMMPTSMPLAFSILENSSAEPRPQSLLTERKSAFLMLKLSTSLSNALASISEVGLMRKM